MSELERGVRIADDAIYLNEDRYNEPKESFKFIGDLIQGDLRTKHQSLLDVGSATGEFVHYLAGRFPNLSFHGVDVSDAMIRQAKHRVPNARFDVVSVLDRNFFSRQRYDLVTCVGVVQMFDDLKTPLYHLIDALNPGSVLYVQSAMNENPIDLFSRYRQIDGKDPRLQLGWNILSKKTYSHLIDSYPGKLTHTYHAFKMPVPISRRKDPMRTWTVPASDGHGLQLVNGACLMINLWVVRICKG